MSLISHRVYDQYVNAHLWVWWVFRFLNQVLKQLSIKEKSSLGTPIIMIVKMIIIIIIIIILRVKIIIIIIIIMIISIARVEKLPYLKSELWDMSFVGRKEVEVF